MYHKKITEHWTNVFILLDLPMGGLFMLGRALKGGLMLGGPPEGGGAPGGPGGGRRGGPRGGIPPGTLREKCTFSKQDNSRKLSSN